jgi:hypothetical protein
MMLLVDTLGDQGKVTATLPMQIDRSCGIHSISVGNLPTLDDAPASACRVIDSALASTAIAFKL